MTRVSDEGLQGLLSDEGCTRDGAVHGHIYTCSVIKSMARELQSARRALEWIADIADKNYEQDKKLRSDGARTLARISDKARALLPTSPSEK